MLKKTLTIIILLLLSITLLISSCTDKEITENKPFTFSILYNNKETAPFNLDWRILEEYKRLKNVTLDVRLGDDMDYETAISLNLNSDDTPDVILKCWPDTIEQYANDGLMLPIGDYLDMMPYFRAYIKEHNLQEEIDKLKADNDKFYLMPGFERKIQVQQWIYRQDVFEKNNIKVPTTYDELFDALVTLKQIYPDSTPITASWGGAHLFSMMGAGYGIPAGWSGTRYYDEKEDKWLFAPATQNYKELYKFLNKCYMAGILDPLTFTQSNEDFIEKLKNGKALVTVTTVRSGLEILNIGLKENGIEEGTWKALPVMESTIGIKKLPPVSAYRVGLVIHAEVIEKEYLNDLISFLDWAVYSKEGMDLTNWGVEGLTYENTDEGKAFLPDILSSKNPEGTINIKKEYGFGMIFDVNENQEYEDYKRPKDIVSFLARSEKADETLTMDPILKLNSNEIETSGIVAQNLDSYIAEASYDFIIGSLNIDDDWQQYIKELDDRGYLILEQIWNDAWIRQND